MSAVPDAVRAAAYIDIENLCGTANPTRFECEQVRELCAEHIDLQQTMVIGACSHFAAATASFAWPAVRWLWRSGKDGADTALLDEIHATEHGRFDRIIIGSGDGIFADTINELAESGVHITVISRQRSLSHHLTDSAADLVILDDPEIIPVTAAA